MRLSALLLLLLQLCCCEEQRRPNGTQTLQISISYWKLGPVHRAPVEPCFEEEHPKERAKLYEALNGEECGVYKARVHSCCSKCPRSEVESCGKAEAECIQEIDFGVNSFCRRRTDFLVRSLIRGSNANNFALVPKFGVSAQLYGNCTVATAKIKHCAVDLEKCMGEYRTQREKRKGEVAREPYECSNQGRICLERVMDIDKSNECAREVGYAWGVMGTRWKAEVDGDEVSSASVYPFNSATDYLQSRWGLSWWGSFGVIVALSMGVATLFFCCCYCCAMARVAKQKEQRRWKQAQKRGVDRYSNVEYTEPSSVRVSRYSTEE